MALLSLPAELRGELKEPLGPVFEDPAELLAGAGEPLIAVGDIVTYHLRRAGYVPDVAVIDGRTEREAVDEAIRETLDTDGPEVRVGNPAGGLSADLLGALREAVGGDQPVVIRVDGEEDLATLPAILAAPPGASVVYGQPGVGMVHVTVDADTRGFVRELFARMDGDEVAALDCLGVG